LITKEEFNVDSKSELSA